MDLLQILIIFVYSSTVMQFMMRMTSSMKFIVIQYSLLSMVPRVVSAMLTATNIHCANIAKKMLTLVIRDSPPVKMTATIVFLMNQMVSQQDYYVLSLPKTEVILWLQLANRCQWYLSQTHSCNSQAETIRITPMINLQAYGIKYYNHHPTFQISYPLAISSIPLIFHSSAKLCRIDVGLINNNCFRMQINIDQYIRNFRIFYQQLARGHPNQENLNKQFKQMIENELKKWKKSYGASRISETSSDNPMLNKLRENRKNKEQTKLTIDIQYSTPKVENCVVYGYLYLIFEYKNVAAFQFLQEQLKEPLSNKDGFTTQMLRKINFVWTKFQETISGKRKVVRFDKQIQEYFKELPQVFVDILYKIITQDTSLNPQNISLYFEDLSQLLTLKIEYFEVNQQQNIKTFVYAQKQRFSLRIGHLKKENVYVNVGKMPQKQEKQVNKEITMQKLGQISAHLGEMYAFNMKDYLNLNNLKNKNNASQLIDSPGSSKLKVSRNQSLLTQPTSQFGSI